MPPAPSRETTQRDHWPIDPQVWRACAGVSTRIPSPGSLAYYFPQGHAEQAFYPPDFSSSSSVPGVRPYFLCRVSGVRLLASAETNEVFARISLDPCVRPPAPNPPPVGSPESSVEEPEDSAAGGVKFFPKALTQSDANNGGGFSVPRFCAENIFPKLDTSNKAITPLQSLTVRDMHGNAWHFKHIYRGSPRRHLLTTGWSKFVNSKKLIAGDTVVFIRNGSGELFVGIRRTMRTGGFPPPATVQYTSPTTGVEIKLDERAFSGEGYWRCLKGRVSAESVVESVRRAEMGVPFEVVYYPKAGSLDFVVAANAVEKALSAPWAAGVQVRMGVETEDSLRTTWLQGTVTGIALREKWPNSPWRALQVTWNDPNTQQQVKSVSPWQVDFVSAIPHFQNPYPATKRPRILEPPDLFSCGESFKIPPVNGFSSVMVGGSGTPSPLDSITSFPAGMQGARHDSFGISRFSNLATSAFIQKDSFISQNNDTIRNLGDVSMELNLGGSSQSGSSSSHSQGSIHSCAREVPGDAEPCKDRDAVVLSFKLFGQTIELGQPPDTETVVGVCSDKSEINKTPVAVARHGDSALLSKRKQMLDYDIASYQETRLVL